MSGMVSGVFEGTSLWGTGRPYQSHTPRKAASCSRSNRQLVECVLAPLEAPTRSTVTSKPFTSEPATSNKNRLQNGVQRTVTTGKALVGQLWGILQKESVAPSSQIRQNERDLQRLGEAAAERGVQVGLILVKVKIVMLGQQYHVC